MQPILLFHIDQIASATNSMATTASSVTTFNQDSNTSNTTTPDAHATTAGGTTMEIVIRRVGMEDHINIVKLFQVGNLFVNNFVKVYRYFK